MDKDDNARKVQHIFMGNKDETIALLPYGYGLYFPEILSYRSSNDKSVIDIVTPLFDNGLHVEAFYKLLKELCTKECCRKILYRECEVI